MFAYWDIAVTKSHKSAEVRLQLFSMSTLWLRMFFTFCSHWHLYHIRVEAELIPERYLRYWRTI